MRVQTLIRCTLALASSPLLASAQVHAQFTLLPDTMTFTSQADQPVAAPQNLGIYMAIPVPFECTRALGGINFVTLSPASGVGNTTVKVSLNPNIVPYMAPGKYTLNLSF